MSARAVSSEGLMGLEDLFPGRLTHIDGKCVLPCGERFQFLAMWILHSPFSIGLLKYSHDVAVAFSTGDLREHRGSCSGY